MLLSNKYKILNVITKGTYSTLYKGIHVNKNSEVAIKIECEEISKKLLDHEIDMYLYLKKFGEYLSYLNDNLNNHLYLLHHMAYLVPKSCSNFG